MRRARLFAIIAMAPLLFGALPAAAQAADTAKSKPSSDGSVTIQRHRGTYCTGVDNTTICIFINIHDWYGWKQSVLRAAGGDQDELWTDDLRLWRNDVITRNTGGAQTWGDPGSTLEIRTSWDKSCGCATWYAQGRGVWVAARGVWTFVGEMWSWAYVD
jgi:hypothetical protein